MPVSSFRFPRPHDSCKKKPRTRGSVVSLRPNCMKTIRPRKMRSSALDLLQHLEHALGSVDEKTLEGLAKAAALQRIAPGAFDFGHVDLLKGGGRIEQNGAFYQRSAEHKPRA